MIIRIKLFIDFVKGKGFFSGDQDAWEITRKMSKWKRRNLVRRGIVPVDFFIYLAIKGVIKYSDVPGKAMTLRRFVDFLWGHPYDNEDARAMGWYFYREILKTQIPSLARSFGERDFVWEELENARNLRRGKGGNKAMMK